MKSKPLDNLNLCLFTVHTYNNEMSCTFKTRNFKYRMEHDSCIRLINSILLISNSMQNVKTVFLQILIFITIDFVLTVRPTCSNRDFQCSSGQCIDIRRRCDGVPDCSDGSDEDRAICGKSSNSGHHRN